MLRKEGKDNVPTQQMGYLLKMFFAAKCAGTRNPAALINGTANVIITIDNYM